MADAVPCPPGDTPTLREKESASRTSDLHIALLVGGCAALVYLPALRLGFFSDDFYFLGRNAPILERPLFLFHIFYRDFIPVVHASFVVDWLMAGIAPTVYHLSSILFHLVTTVLLLLLLRSLGGSRIAAAATTLVWALNPHISEAVIWVAARGHSLATLFLVACMLVLSTHRRLLPALALALVALGAKETALFPLVLTPLLDRERRIWWPAVWFFAPVCVAFAVFNVVAKPHLHLARATVGELFLQGPFLLLRPLGLSQLYNFSAISAVTVYLVVVAAGLLLAKRPCARIGLGWLLASLVPIVVQPVYSSRYFYLISVGYALLGCALLDGVRARVGSVPARRVAAAAAAILLVLMTAADVVYIAREIGDYRVLCAPYMRVVEMMTPHLEALQPGESLAVVDLGPRRSIAELNATITERGNLEKLIPFRSQGLDGTVELVDLANAVHPHRRGWLAHPVDVEQTPIMTWLVYDGRHLLELAEAPSELPAADRVLAVGYGPAALYFAHIVANERPR